jgi:hypothetical protein
MLSCEGCAYRHCPSVGRLFIIKILHTVPHNNNKSKIIIKKTTTTTTADLFILKHDRFHYLLTPSVATVKTQSPNCFVLLLCRLSAWFLTRMSFFFCFVCVCYFSLPSLPPSFPVLSHSSSSCTTFTGCINLIICAQSIYQWLNQLKITDNYYLTK